MKYVTADYSVIDPAIDAWAANNELIWKRDDRGMDVRTIHWPLPNHESVQIWLDPPVSEMTTVHVCHNTSDGGKRHNQVSIAAEKLGSTLDDYLGQALSLVRELER